VSAGKGKEKDYSGTAAEHGHTTKGRDTQRISSGKRGRRHEKAGRTHSIAEATLKTHQAYKAGVTSETRSNAAPIHGLGTAGKGNEFETQGQQQSTGNTTTGQDATLT